jgi:hypothetical protein
MIANGFLATFSLFQYPVKYITPFSIDTMLPRLFVYRPTNTFELAGGVDASFCAPGAEGTCWALVFLWVLRLPVSALCSISYLLSSSAYANFNWYRRRTATVKDKEGELIYSSDRSCMVTNPQSLIPKARLTGSACRRYIYNR